ncbi:MAG: pinensin family lanthipeptide [Saprospiraceae bacterium]|nr:pinensin family lanthipeptide [Saprospiraceae bacterium]MDW8228673.1 pinensin family lanthipeptide [Saprospiraceae bacterium]
MKKTKLTLQQLQLESFVTALEPEQMVQVKGGRYEIRGRRFTYRTRWTSVDTRSDEMEGTQPSLQVGSHHSDTPRTIF